MDCAYLGPCASIAEPGEVLPNGSAGNGDARPLSLEAWLDEEQPCQHPDHGYTTRRACISCPDYLFPLLSPRTPREDVWRLWTAPAAQLPHHRWRWRNVQAAFHQMTERAIDNLPSYPGGFSGRGVVILGGGKYFPAAYVTIRVLRHVGCDLPIELWHFRGEVGALERELVEPLGVTCVDGEEHARQSGFPLHSTWWKGWQLKPYAMVHSRFRELLYLDADCYPVRDPAPLFDERAYRDRGAIFWPDIDFSVCLFPSEAPEVFGVTTFSDQPAETGQLLIHKEHCWRELNLALFFNEQADFTYRILWGDKDTFPMAWKRLGREYARLWPNAQMFSQGVLQFDAQGSVLFVHRATDKFRLPGTQFSSNYQWQPANTFNPQLAHERFCFDVIHALAERYAEASHPQPAA